MADTTEWRCYMCKQVKPLSEYAKDKSRKNGHTHRCRDCDSNYWREKRLRWKDTEHYKTRMHVGLAKHIRENPKKTKARVQAFRAHLRKDKCENCGATGKLHGHHPDYDKPLDVITLCIPCHVKAHHPRFKGES